MATEWDLTGDICAPIIDTQPNRVRSRPITASFTVIAIAAGAMFCAEAPVVSCDPGWASANIISVETVARSEPAVSRSPRKSREHYSPDARAGMSTRRLADTVTTLFTPVEEPSVDVEYSFG